MKRDIYLVRPNLMADFCQSTHQQARVHMWSNFVMLLNSFQTMNPQLIVRLINLRQNKRKSQFMALIP